MGSPRAKGPWHDPSMGVGFRVRGLGCRVQALGFRVWGLGFKVQRKFWRQKSPSNEKCVVSLV